MCVPGLGESGLVVSLFGSFTVKIHGQAMPRLRSLKGQWLLALLILHRNRPVERQWLAGVLWEESTDSQALANLRLTLTDLRRALGAEAGRILSPTHRTLGFQGKGASVDVAAFDEASAGEGEAAMRRAVALYVGPLLEGCTEPWALQERAHREDAYFRILQSLAAEASREQDFAAAAGYLRRVVAAAPLRESAQRALMEALVAAGDHAAATMAYRELRARLHREMNIEPSEETTEVFRRIRPAACIQASRSRTAPDASRVVLPPYCVPWPLNSLIGRHEETQEVALLLKTARLVTLAGPGGIGKTRLAVAVAETAAVDYPDGVWFVDLAALIKPAFVLEAVASAMGVRPQPGREPGETLAETLKAKTILLILDNCEHLLQACAHSAQKLLGACPDLRILATSRQSLGITGERIYRVPTLSLPPSGPQETESACGSTLMEYEAVQLFVERAQQTAGAFKVTPQNLAAISQVVRGLDGLPLAIELAAVWVRSLTAEEIRVWMDDSRFLLDQAAKSTTPRHRTLRATLDWSYALLDDSHKALLCSLAVFVGGWTLNAAQSIYAAENDDAFQFLGTLSQLVDNSLVVCEEQDGQSRYRLLATVRQYCLEKLAESAERPETYTRHARHFLALAEAAEPHLTGSEQLHWAARLEAEHGNFSAALEWCKQDPERTEMGLRIAGAIWRYWLGRHPWEGRKHLVDLLGRDKASIDKQTRAKGHMAAGNLAYVQGDYTVARAHHETSLKLRTEAADPEGEAASLGYLGLIALQCDDPGLARALLYRSLTILESLDSPKELARILQNLGAAVMAGGDYTEARSLLERCAAVNRAQGDRFALSVTLNTLVEAALESGDDPSARSLLEQVSSVDQELGSAATCLALQHRGVLALRDGNDDLAETLFEQDLALRIEVGDRQGTAYALKNLADLRHSQNDFPREIHARKESVRLFQTVGHSRGVVFGLEGFARLALARGEAERATQLWGAAQTLRSKIGAAIAPADLPERDRMLSRLRAALGPSAFKVDFTRGEAMAMEEAISYALTGLPD